MDTHEVAMSPKRSKASATEAFLVIAAHVQRRVGCGPEIFKCPTVMKSHGGANQTRLARSQVLITILSSLDTSLPKLCKLSFTATLSGPGTR